MALYRYVKKQPKKRRNKKFVSLILSFSGLFLIAYVVYPIVSFELFDLPRLTKTARESPKEKPVLTEIKNAEEKVLGDQSPPQLTATDIDYSKIESWIPKEPEGEVASAGRIYFLSIPKLRINDAVVEIAGKSLDHTLVHYGGTGLPGEYGNGVIFGHSILPQFYDPKNYKSIFSLLPTLHEGDELFIKYDGVTYKYVVWDMRAVSPDDPSMLEQKYDNSYISLITCVPPGTYWKRLIVTAILQKY